VALVVGSVLGSLLVIPFAGAAVNVGLFELDGNAVASPTLAGDDWSTLFPANGSSTVYSEAFASDRPPADTSYFTIASKDVNDVSTWNAHGPGAPDKDEITSSYAATYKTGANDTTIFFGADRYANNGDSSIGFWFLQHPISINPVSGNFVGTHAVNDTLIVSDFTNGGVVATITVYRWDPHAAGGPLVLVASGQDCAAVAAIANVCAKVNAASAAAPWSYTPKSGSAGTFPARTFFEGGINLTAVYPTAPCFTNFLAETRSSQSTTATLKDLVLHGFNNCPIVPPLSAFDLLKTADALSVPLGSPIGFNVTATNGGPDVSFDTNVSDPLPAIAEPWTIDGVWAVPSGAASSGCAITGSAPSQTLTCAFGSLDVFEGRAVHVSATTGSTADCGLRTNVAFLTTNHNASQSQNATASEYVSCSDVSVEKSVIASPVSLGTDVSYTLVVHSNGPDAADGVSLSDPIPAFGSGWTAGGADAGACSIGAGALSCDFGTVNAGDSRTVTLTASTGVTADCGTWLNVATVSATLDTDSTNNEASAAATVQCPGLTIVKTADAPSVSAGSAIGFSVYLNNTGNGTASGVTLRDALPAGAGISWSIETDATGLCGIATGALTCSYGDLAAGNTRIVHVTSGTGFTSCAVYFNEASANATNQAAVTASATTEVLCPALDPVKLADAPSVSAGSPIGFGIWTNNTGNGTATAVMLSDPLPTGTGIAWSIDTDATGLCSITGDTLTCAYGDLLSGASLFVHVTSPTTGGSCGAHPNVATITATNHPSVNASDSTTVLCPTLGIVKTSDAPSVSAGSNIGFTISVNNSGSGTATGVSLSDVLPTGSGVSWSIDTDATGLCGIGAGTLSCDYGDLASGETRVVHVTSGTAYTSCGLYTNVADLTATNAPALNATASTTVLCPALSIVKTADAPSVSAGSPIGFTIYVNNSGSGTATGVSLSDPLPAGSGVSWSISLDATGLCGISAGTLTCSYGDLVGGATRALHVTSGTAFASCADYTNVADLSATNAPPLHATATTTVLCPGMTLVKLADAPSVAAGSPIGFGIWVNSSGAGTETGVSLVDPLPGAAGLAWTIDADATGLCGISAGTLSCDYGDLTSGATRFVHVTSPTTTASCGRIDNTATARNQEPMNASASTTVTCPQNATRTLGFWQTHTAYTERVFDANFSDVMTVGSGGHTKTIDSYGKLFGGFYASIPSKSDGHKRNPVDQARMTLLQQLIAAKLNCAAFGCSASTQSLISAADNAYATNDRATMASLTAQLDAYNNSGDGVPVSNTGSATPALSQGIANIPFWDNP
jgi:uncharacterized repeat protein (TIGR01451 family)